MEIAATDTNEKSQWLPSPGRLAKVALALACLDLAALLLNVHSWQTGGVTILWPTNGLLLGILLCVPRRHWPAYIAVGFAVDLAVNRSLSFYFWPSAYFAACNMLEAGLAAVLLYRTISPKPDLTQRRQLVRLILYGVIVAPVVASLCAQLNTATAHSLPLFNSFKHWFTADALGIAVMTPLYLSLHQRERFSRRSRLEITGLLMMLFAATLAVFWQTRFPCLYLLLPFLLLLGVRLRLAGSAIGLLIISIVGGYFTIAGHGPLALMRPTSGSSRDLALQFFIAVSMLVLYSIDVVIAESERLQANLQSSESRFRLLAEASSDVIVLTDLYGERRYVSPAIATVLGWQPEDLLGHDYRQIVHPDDIAKLASLMDNCREGEPVEALAYRCRKKNGSYLWMEANIRLYRNESTGNPIGFVNVVRDISSRKAAEQELNLAFSRVANLALVDGLTGIANRRQFDDTMDGELRRAMRDRSTLSLLMIDVDHFKSYNDLYGHVSGDACLRQIAAAAQEALHRTSDLLARYGGEEFVAVLPNTDTWGAQLLAEQIRSAVQLCRLPHAGNPHGVVTVSIGCATQILNPESVGNPLLLAADEALYEAKSAGRNRIEVAEMQPAVT
jgi:diguanylate cyclase (GGDEF)-like protein/PAS domain S-box-containing protein